MRHETIFILGTYMKISRRKKERAIHSPNKSIMIDEYTTEEVVG